MMNQERNVYMNNIAKKIVAIILALTIFLEMAPITTFAASKDSAENNNQTGMIQPLAEVVDEINKPIPEKLLNTINEKQTYNKLTNTDKKELGNYLNLSEDNLNEFGNEIKNIEKLSAIVLNAKNAGITNDTALSLAKEYTFEECINIEKKFDYISENIIDTEYIDDYATILSDSNIKLNDIYGSMILSKITNNDYSWAFEKADIKAINVESNNSRDSSYISLQLEYNISSEAINDACIKTGKNPSQLLTEMKSFQETSGIYSLNSDLSTSDVSTQEIPQRFSKYQMPDASNYRDNLSVDQTYGMVTYNKELITLKGKNGLDLEFGIRFDQNDAILPSNYKDLENPGICYQVQYTVDWYSITNGGEPVLKKADTIHVSDIYYDEAKHNEYLNKDYIVETVIDPYLIYIYYVKDACIISKDIDIFEESPNTTSHNNQIYNLGEGWAFTVPSIELFTLDYSYGMRNVIHFADGQKYSFLKKDGKYELIGYDFKDLQLLDATTNEFSCDGKSAEWVLLSKSGRCDYFSSDGLYIGSTDQRGNKAKASIKAYYNSSDQLIKITDSVGRSIEINHCVDEYEDEWTGVYKDYYTEIVLCDNDSKTKKKIYRLTKFVGGTSNGVPLLSVLSTLEDNKTIKSTRFSYNSLITNFFYNYGGGFMYLPGTAEEVYPRRQLDNIFINTLADIYDYSEEDGKEGAHLKIEYDTALRYVSNASIISYPRVKSVKSTEQKFDEDYNYIIIPKNIEEYKYYIENKKTNERIEINPTDQQGSKQIIANGNWNASLDKFWPQDTTDDYVLEKKEEFKDNKAQKSIEYHYGDDRYNDLISVYDLSGAEKKLYSCNDIERTNNNHNIMETVRLVNDDGLYFCTLQKTEFDDYANIIYEWSAGGSSKKNEAVEAYYTISSQTAEYNGTNKSIPTVEMVQTLADEENMHYVFLKTQNTLDNTNTNIVKQDKYIYESIFNWDSLKETETNTPIDSISYTYDSQGRVIKSDQTIKTDSDGTNHQIIEYTYDSKYGSYIETTKNIDAYYDKNGELIDSQKSYTYDILGRILSCKDNTDNYITTYQYDTLGTVIKSVNPDGTQITTEPDYTNKIVIETLADGTKSKYVYDIWDNLAEEYVWHPDDNKYLLVAEYEYDTNNRNTKKYEYTNETSTKYLCTSYEYDFLGRIVRETQTDEKGTVLSDYSVETKITTLNSAPCEKQTTTYYNSDGTINSHVIEYNDVGGNTIRVENEYEKDKYYIDSYTYDNYNRLVSTSGDTVDSLNYIYDDLGRVVQIKDADNNSVYYSYDSQNQIIKQSDDNGSEVLYYYTPHGVLYRTDTLVDTIDGTDYYSKSISAYDVHGNVVQSKQNSNKPGETEKFNISNYSYDTNGRVTMVEDIIDSSNSRYAQYCYDSSGNLIKSFTGLTSPLTITDSENYKANDDKEYSVVSYEYDEFGNQTKYTDPLGNSETYEYSFSNLLSKKTLRNGSTVNYSYDSAGRCLSKTAGDKSIIYTYDSIGNLASVQDEFGTTSYSYDLMKRIVSETRDDVEDSRDYTSQYEYSGTGITDYKLSTRNRDTGEMQTSVHETYNYNNLKQISKFTHSDIASPNEIISVSYNYGKSGELTNKQISGASIQQEIDYTYNKAGLNTQISSLNYLSEDADKSSENREEFLFNENYQYSLNGDLTNKSRVEKAVSSNNILIEWNSQTSYFYDSLNRLTKEQHSESQNNGVVSNRVDYYIFDESDNRLSKTTDENGNTISTSYQYDSANKLISDNNSNGIQHTYTYDKSGNLLSESISDTSGVSQQNTLYTYDAFNRLSSVQKNGCTYSYLYDGTDRRIQKDTPEKELQEFWNNGRITFENEITESEQTQIYHSYIFDTNLLAVASEDNFTNVAITDAHGDTVKLLSSETPIETAYQYDAFGIQKSENTPDIYNPYQYNGKYLDEETDLYYLNARYYNPEIGRFIQEDTYHGNTQNTSTLNLYNYCGSNPVAYEDPSGHAWETVFDVASLALSAYDFIKKPNLVNGLFLAWDIVSVVAPFVPGSYVAKGIKLIAKGVKYVAKAVKTVSKSAKVIRTVDRAADTVRYAKKAKSAYEAAQAPAKAVEKKRQLLKVASENKVADLVKSLSKTTPNKTKTFTKEAAEQAVATVSYTRPSGYRKGVREAVWDQAKKEGGGIVRDPLTGQEIHFEDAWDMGHKPGFEFRKHQNSARRRGISRKQFLDEYNNPNHFRPELPSSNRSHYLEDMTDNYYGP